VVTSFKEPLSKGGGFFWFKARRERRRKRISGEENHAKTQRCEGREEGKREEEKRLVPFFFLGELCTFAPLREVFCRNFWRRESREDAEVLRTRRGRRGERVESRERWRKKISKRCLLFLVFFRLDFNDRLH